MLHLCTLKGCQSLTHPPVVSVWWVEVTFSSWGAAQVPRPGLTSSDNKHFMTDQIVLGWRPRAAVRYWRPTSAHDKRLSFAAADMNGATIVALHRNLINNVPRGTVGRPVRQRTAARPGGARLCTGPVLRPTVPEPCAALALAAAPGGRAQL